MKLLKTRERRPAELLSQALLVFPELLHKGWVTKDVSGAAEPLLGVNLDHVFNQLAKIRRQQHRNGGRLPEHRCYHARGHPQCPVIREAGDGVSEAAQRAGQTEEVERVPEVLSFLGLRRQVGAVAGVELEHPFLAEWEVELGVAEVRHLETALTRDEHVVGFQVAVHDAFVVDEVERFQELRHSEPQLLLHHRPSQTVHDEMEKVAVLLVGHHNALCFVGQLHVAVDDERMLQREHRLLLDDCMLVFWGHPFVDKLMWSLVCVHHNAMHKAVAEGAATEAFSEDDFRHVLECENETENDRS